MNVLSAHHLHPSWQAVLAAEFDQPYMQQLRHFLNAEQAADKVIYPPKRLIFNALQLTPFDQVKVVILGQDPYHGPNQAHGLSFSVPEGVPHPPSLRNIFTELASDLNQPVTASGDLSAWAEQGVLLLNATLTVEQARAGSHQRRGWETFTDAAIRALNEQRQGLVFILWGSYAQKKGSFIDTQRHKVLASAHPSPLSVYRGFWGSRPFSQANQYLIQQGHNPIQWL